MRTPSRQSGVTTVEFAIIGAVVIIMLFAVIEVGRTMFVMNSLNESTRRAARLATVCPINDPAIAEVAFLNAPGGGTTSRFIAGLAPENFVLEYLDEDGNPISDPVGSFLDIHFVRTRIVNYQHQMLIPYLDFIFTTPEFQTTLRRESLGVPRDGVVTPC